MYGASNRSTLALVVSLTRVWFARRTRWNLLCLQNETRARPPSPCLRRLASLLPISFFILHISRGMTNIGSGYVSKEWLQTVAATKKAWLPLSASETWERHVLRNETPCGRERPDGEPSCLGHITRPCPSTPLPRHTWKSPDGAPGPQAHCHPVPLSFNSRLEPIAEVLRKHTRSRFLMQSKLFLLSLLF